MSGRVIGRVSANHKSTCSSGSCNGCGEGRCPEPEPWSDDECEDECADFRDLCADQERRCPPNPCDRFGGEESCDKPPNHPIQPPKDCDSSRSTAPVKSGGCGDGNCKGGKSCGTGRCPDVSDNSVLRSLQDSECSLPCELGDICADKSRRCPPNPCDKVDGSCNDEASRIAKGSPKKPKTKKFNVTWGPKIGSEHADLNPGTRAIHVNGHVSPVLHLVRGSGYYFKVTQAPNADGSYADYFLFTTNPVGHMNSKEPTPLPDSFASIANGEVAFRVTDKTPRYFWYQSSTGCFQGGLVIVRDQ